MINGELLSIPIDPIDDKRLGFLIHFHVPLIKGGIRRIANHFPTS